MELIPVSKLPGGGEKLRDTIPQILESIEVISSNKPFVEANTFGCSLTEIKEHHIIPVFTKDNEPVISHAEFIEATMSVVNEVYLGESIVSPYIRLSHPVKGRVPEAKYKSANELLEHEKTLYFERMAFVIDIPSIHTDIDGNRLNLTVGGVKAYNLDNLHTKRGADQHFKVFIGFKNLVCTNLCISTDGLLSQLKVKNVEQLKSAIHAMLINYNAVLFSEQLKELQDYQLSEMQFAQLIGRCRMYKYLSESSKMHIPLLQFGDNQINMVCKDYYSDNSFCSNPDGSINLWKLYNLFTGANKSTYIDNILDRGANAFQLVKELQFALQTKSVCWFLN